MNNNNKKLAIGFVTYNDITAKYLPSFLLSLFGQSFVDFEIFVADNSEKEENKNTEYIKNNFPDIDMKWMEENAGFAQAYNYLIEKAVSKEYEYFMVINPDIVLESDALQKLLSAIDSDETLGSVCPKIFNWDFDNDLKTNNIDTCGLVMPKPLRFIDLGQGEIDHGQFDGKEIIGPSGAAGLYRMSALLKIKDANGFFDDRMFMYKEDCDLAYRLFKKDFKSRCVSDALIYHDRTAKSIGNSNWSIFLNRRNKSVNVKKWSFVNQQLLFKKHWGNLDFKDKLSVLAYQVKIFSFVFFFEHYLLTEWKELKRGLNYKSNL